MIFYWFGQGQEHKVGPQTQQFLDNLTLHLVGLWAAYKCSFTDFLSQKKVQKNISTGHKFFKKFLKFQNFIEIFHCCLTRLKNKKYDLSSSYLFTTATLRNENMRQTNFKKLFKFHNFREIFYCDMIRNQEHKFGCFSTIAIYQNYFRKEKYGQVHFKACVHYFLSKFYFSPNDTLSKTMKNDFLINFKSFFRSWDIQVFVFLSSPLFPPVSHLFRGWSKINLNKNLITFCSIYWEGKKAWHWNFVSWQSIN